MQQTHLLIFTGIRNYVANTPNSAPRPRLFKVNIKILDDSLLAGQGRTTDLCLFSSILSSLATLKQNPAPDGPYGTCDSVPDPAAFRRDAHSGIYDPAR